MQESSTYEATKARRSTSSQPDKIHWEDSSAFRDSPYRQLHHQQGVTGIFRVRLLEASDLQRSYWSALAMGPMKHLGISKAHGAISSFVSFSLDYVDPHCETAVATVGTATAAANMGDSKPAAVVGKGEKTTVVSPVVQTDSNPVWENCQFEFLLRKGALVSDGRRIHLDIRVAEDSTAVENFLPGTPKGDARLIGVGDLDVTDLCLGESTETGQALPGVLDAWIPMSLQGQEEEDELDITSYNKNDPLAPPVKKQQQDTISDPPAVTGMVRILVSYQPIGLDPQPKDIVALEAFARRNPSSNSCTPVLPPLMPLTVLERRGAYLLCEYRLAACATSNITRAHQGSSSSGSNRAHKTACVRLHRNACFVIERQNLVDAAHNLALLPADVWMSTPLGQAIGSAAGPVLAASEQLLMPAMLSFKLLWMAARTTTLASFSGVQALGSTLWREGSTSLTSGQHNNAALNHHQGVQRSNSRASHREGVRRSSSATAKYVQL